MVYNENPDRRASLLRLAPDVFKYKSVLYIGAKHGRFHFGNDFKNSGYEISILEVFEPNVKFLKTLPWIEKVYHADVRKVDINKKFDIIFWWHGPEHILQSEIPNALARLELLANIAVILGCPWGHSAQGAVKGNKFETHLSHLDYKIFEDLGYSVECIGIKGGLAKSNITSVKYLKSEVL